MGIYLLPQAARRLLRAHGRHRKSLRTPVTVHGALARGQAFYQQVPVAHELKPDPFPTLTDMQPVRYGTVLADRNPADGHRAGPER